MKNNYVYIDMEIPLEVSELLCVLSKELMISKRKIITRAIIDFASNFEYLSFEEASKELFYSSMEDMVEDIDFSFYEVM